MEIKKHLILTGNSTVSWKDAIVKAIAEASKTIDYISEVKILEQRANVDANKISEYFVGSGEEDSKAGRAWSDYQEGWQNRI